MSFEYASTILLGLFVVLILRLLRFAPEATPRKEKNLRRKADSNITHSYIAKEPWYKQTPRTNQTYLIVGGCGFVGRRLIRALRLRGESRIKVLDISAEAFTLLEDEDSEAVEKIVGDVRDPSSLIAACNGVDVVFSVFAIIRFMDRLASQYELSHNINVIGTENVVNACIESNVKVLIQTSTSSVFQTTVPGALHLGMDEHSPKCTRENATCHYGLTKMLAEEIVLKANGRNGLKTGVIRPCGTILGYGDELFLGRILRLKNAPLLNPGFTQDFTPVDCIIHSHLLLESNIMEGKENVAGEAFCISNDDPWKLEDLVDVLNDLDSTIVPQVVPLGIVWILSHIIELLSWSVPLVLFQLLPSDLQVLTPPALMNATTSFSFKSERARKVLGYSPVISTEGCLKRTLEERKQARMLF